MVVTDKEALLWVDSRYFLQGAQQIEGSGIILMKDGLPDTPSIAGYLCENLSKGDKVGINGMLMSIDETAVLRSRLNAAGIELDVDFDPIDRIWTDRPALPLTRFLSTMKNMPVNQPSRKWHASSTQPKPRAHRLISPRPSTK